MINTLDTQTKNLCYTYRNKQKKQKNAQLPHTQIIAKKNEKQKNEIFPRKTELTKNKSYLFISVSAPHVFAVFFSKKIIISQISKWHIRKSAKIQNSPLSHFLSPFSFFSYNSKNLSFFFSPTTTTTTKKHGNHDEYSQKNQTAKKSSAKNANDIWQTTTSNETRNIPVYQEQPTNNNENHWRNWKQN